MTTPWARRTRSIAATVIAAALISTVGVASAADTAAPRDIGTFACPDTVGADPFVDTAGNVHGEAIHCAVAHGFMQGRSADTFEPAGLLTRGQAATVLFHLLQLADVPMDPQGAEFTDIAGNVHEASIRAIASIRVVHGATDTTFEPDRTVTRAQLAKMLTNAVVATGAFLEIGPELFDDDNGNVHETAIDALATNGIAAGVAPRLFAPSNPVRRDAAASLVMRGTDFAVENGGVRSPHADDDRAATLTPDQVAGGSDDDDASGRAWFWTMPQGDLVCFRIGTDGVGAEGQDHPERAAYLAAGAPGVAGEILVELPPPSADNDVPDGFHAWSAGCVQTDPAVVQRLVEDPEDLYVGVATVEHDEVIRGQLEVAVP